MPMWCTRNVTLFVCQVYLQTKCKKSDRMEEKSAKGSKQAEEGEHSELKVIDGWREG